MKTITCGGKAIKGFNSYMYYLTHWKVLFNINN